MHKIRSVIFIVIILISYSTFAQQQKHISFDENWKFHFGHAADPAKDFNYGITAIFSKSGKTDNTALAIKFNDSSWRQLNLPHDWAVELPFENSSSFDVQSHGYKPVGGLYPQTSIGWYRKHFSIAKKKIPANDFKFSLMACFVMPIFGSMDFIWAIIKAGTLALLTTLPITSTMIKTM